MKIEYLNKSGSITKYWIGIKSLNVARRMLTVDGLHQGKLSIEELNIYIDSIQTAVIIDGTYCPINQKLVSDIAEYPDKYKTLFDSVANLKILNYLEMCNRLDATPYLTEYELIQYMDRETFKGAEYHLSKEQFKEIVQHFSLGADKKKNGSQYQY